MPQNFPEAWLSRVREQLSTAHQAPFLDGIPELEGDIVEMGEENMIHVPIETFSPEVLYNNSTYPIGIQEFTDGTKSVSLGKFQTKATRVSHDSATGASYSKIDNATRGHIKQINRNKFKRAIHALAPASNSPLTPVITLPDNYTSGDVYKALVDLKDRWDKAEVPEDGRRVVLASSHYNKLLEDRERYGDLLVNHNAGKVSRTIAGFDVFTYVSNPYYTKEGVKKGFGAVADQTDKQATVAFWQDNIGKKTGLTYQYYDQPNTTQQAHLVAYRHYFVVLPLKNEAIGAII